jgi:hypothetical protein
MFAKRGPFVSIAQRKVAISGGERGVDYNIDGVKNGIFLYTADKEQLTKSKKHVIMLVCKARPADRHVAVKVNPELYRLASVTAPAWIDPDDTGEIVLNITPRVDIDLGSLDYIVKLLVEGMN